MRLHVALYDGREPSGLLSFNFKQTAHKLKAGESGFAVEGIAAFCCDAPMMPEMPNEAPFYDTGEASYHIHRFQPMAAFTDVPKGMFEGHRHPIERNENGLITGFGDSEGHTHPLPSYMVEMGKLFAERFAKKPDKKGDDSEEDYDDDALEDIDELFTVEGVEIFAVGKWNGDDYTLADLQDMVDSFGLIGFQVPIKLGHKERSGAPAYGWVDSISIKGDRLVATFRDIPKNLYDAIKGHRFDAVSSEIFWNLERNGKKYRRVLKAVAVLGAETPGVSDLAPLRTVVNSVLPPTSGYDRVSVHTILIEDLDMDNIMDLKAKVQSLTAELEAAQAALADAMQKAKDGDKAAMTQLSVAQAKVAQLQAALDTAQKEITKLAEDSAKQLAALQTQLAGQGAVIAQMQEDQRQVMIKREVDRVPIPTLRPYVQALYDALTAPELPKTVKFTEGTGKDKKDHELSPSAILNRLVEFLRKDSNKLFSEFAQANVVEREEGDDIFQDSQYADPSAEVASRVAKYREEHPKLTYRDAAAHVLGADEELRDAYANFTTSKPRAKQ